MGGQLSILGNVPLAFVCIYCILSYLLSCLVYICLLLTYTWLLNLLFNVVLLKENQKEISENLLDAHFVVINTKCSFYLVQKVLLIFTYHWLFEMCCLISFSRFTAWILSKSKDKRITVLAFFQSKIWSFYIGLIKMYSVRIIYFDVFEVVCNRSGLDFKRI